MTFEQFLRVRNRTEYLCENLEVEDYVIQADEHVSPVKWHLAHTTWFFETFVLKKFQKDYQEFHSDFSFFFNSYYNTVGQRTARNHRGLMTRPTVEEVYDYRGYVNEQIGELLDREGDTVLTELLVLGINHEQQHQELLMTDLKYNLFFNPLYPAVMNINEYPSQAEVSWVEVGEGLYAIGYEGNGFSFDNEHRRHQVYLESYSIASGLVTNREYLEFIEDGGYEQAQWWHSEGWEWVQANRIKMPKYWLGNEHGFRYYTLDGAKEVEMQAPLAHISYYEAAAFAEWKGCRLPAEAEWEVASGKFKWGSRWEWTNSAYLPYPGFQKAEGAIGEYNGKFMVNQMVLRGASVATSEGHSRRTYRNFFHPNLRWQFTGIRLIKK